MIAGEEGDVHICQNCDGQNRRTEGKENAPGDAEQGLPSEPDPLLEHHLRGLGRVEEDPRGPGEEQRPHKELEHGSRQRRQRGGGRRGRALGHRGIAAAAVLQERLLFLSHGEGTSRRVVGESRAALSPPPLRLGFAAFIRSRYEARVDAGCSPATATGG
uniref:Uncharacterized protein n=1 Tax=Arundo donax TaxID=35708 RepID=A0A0A9DTV6_ARUDO